MMKQVILISFLVLLNGCANKTIRTNVSVRKFGNLIVTNSQTNPYKVRKSGDGVDFLYIFIAKNSSSKNTSIIKTGEAHLIINGFKYPMVCTQKMVVGPVIIPPKEYAKFECRILVLPDEKNLLSMRDTNVDIVVPQKSGVAITNTFLFTIEDFE